MSNEKDEMAKVVKVGFGTIPCFPCDKEMFPCAYGEVENDRESTTFYNDFKIAEPFGLGAVKDTFNRAFKEWSRNAKYLVELTAVVNHLCWEHYRKGNEELSEYYGNCYHKGYDAMFDSSSPFTKEEMAFMFKVID